jgi:fermentation-respiration switch protein FrsA (DUF1100 family)
MPGFRLLIIIAGVYVAITAFLYIFQSSFVYFPERSLMGDPSRIGLEYEPVYFETPDKIKLSGWFIPNESDRGVILFCHGNAGNISHRLDSIEIFHRLGLEVFIFDYRGYGLSEGNPSEQGTYRDAKAAWHYLIEQRQVNPDEIIVFGRSLGGGIASWLAESNQPAALILESTFVSLPDVAAVLYPYFPVRLLLRFEYNTVEHLRGVNCPVLIIHSRDDEIMPFTQGQQLFEMAKEPKKFLEISGTHNGGFITSGKYYESGIDEFVFRFVEHGM